MKSEPQIGPDTLPSLHVLHLEDSEIDANLVAHTISDEGLECHINRVASRADFINALNRKQYDVILADYTLPGYSGDGALKDVREIQPMTPVIFVSGTIGEEQAIEIMKTGALDYVLKHRMARLVPAIRRAVHESREHARRVHAEQELQITTRRFREMADNIKEVFWIRSADGFSVHYASPACEPIWGYPPAMIYNKSTLWLESIVAEDRSRLIAALGQLRLGTPYTLAYRITRPDGKQRWIEERGFPVRSDSGIIERTVAASVDITERKALEEQLKQSQKMEAIGQLAGGIAHDFSNMLSVINGYSNMLLDNTELPPDATELLRQIYVAGGRAASLTRQLLIFSRKAHPHSHVVDLNEIVSDLTTMLSRLIGERLTLQLDLASGLPPTFADTGMIEQVLMNLVVNARDATNGTGIIVISTGACEVTEQDRARNPEARVGAHLWLSVRDTGCGIPPEVLPRIFEPFFTTKAAGHGTGLGLSTVIGIARQHEGWVEVESEVGNGSLFRVFLPLASEDAQSASPYTASPAQVRGGKEVILLAEDEESVRAYTRTVLEMYGYRVIPTANGPAAVEAWKIHGDRVALLLTDLVMTDEMTGLDLAENLRAQRPDLKVIFYSGYSTEASATMLANHKNYTFLQKPFQPNALARLVRDAIDGTERTGSHAPFARPPNSPA